MLLRQGEKSPAAGLVVVSENGEEEKEKAVWVEAMKLGQ